ncbi:MAG TPA: hypothetical protein VIK06_06115 [Candidatus Limnocylindrales bacterium]|jgi:hypothetical protein
MRGSVTAPSWLGRIRLAAAFGLEGSDVPTIALAGLLVRGGIVLLLLPVVVLPSVIAIAGATGARAFTLSGDATPWFVEVLAVVGVGLLVWLVTSVVIGSLVDVCLVRAALEVGDDGIDRALPVVGSGLIVRLASIRLACLVPLAVALIWAGGRVYTATYNELITPSDLAVALPLRVIGDATDAVAVVVVTWLASETIAAIAIRRLILTGGAVWRAIAGALAQVVKRPVWTLLTAATSLAPSGAALFVALFGTATAYGWVTVAARSEQPIVLLRFAVFVLAVLALAAAWILALALSGVTSAWRSAAFTHEVAAVLGRDRISAEATETIADRRRSIGPAA